MFTRRYPEAVESIPQPHAIFLRPILMLSSHLSIIPGNSVFSEDFPIPVHISDVFHAYYSPGSYQPP
jgi:hypothetical protein